MLKTIKTLILITLTLVLLSGCGGQKYLSYEEAYQKLEEAGYDITGKTDKDGILEIMQDVAMAYKQKSDDNDEYPELDEVQVESLITASNDSMVVVIFYCEDEDSAIIISHALDIIYSEYMDRLLSGYVQNIAYLYSYEVHDILQFHRTK